MNEFVLFVVSQLDFGKEGGLHSEVTYPVLHWPSCRPASRWGSELGPTLASPDSLPSAVGTQLTGAPLLGRAGILHVAHRRAPPGTAGREHESFHRVML